MKIIPTGFKLRSSTQGGRAVILEIDSLEGKNTVFISPESAEELGKELLAHALCINGRIA